MNSPRSATATISPRGVTRFRSGIPRPYTVAQQPVQYRASVPARGAARPEGLRWSDPREPTASSCKGGLGWLMLMLTQTPVLGSGSPPYCPSLPVYGKGACGAGGWGSPREPPISRGLGLGLSRRSLHHLTTRVGPSYVHLRQGTRKSCQP